MSDALGGLPSCPALPFQDGAVFASTFWIVNRVLLVCLLSLGAPAWPAPAQNARAPEVQRLELERLAFHKKLLESGLEPLKQHLTSLTALEKQLAQAGDYTGAIEARNERKRLTTELERLDKELLLAQMRAQSIEARLLPDRIPMELSAAELDGGTRLEGGEIVGWSRPGASAKWKLPALPAGGYEVIVRYRCGPVEGGQMEVKETRYSLTTEVQTTLRGPEEKNIGTLKITDGSGPLVISARSVVKDNLMHLMAVHLTPAGR